VSAQPRMKLQSAEPRIFGVVPPAVALVLGFGALVVGIVVLVSGAALAGVIWLAAGVALLALAMDASRRWPASALPRLAVRVADGTGRHLGLARATAGAWGQASRRRVSMRHELHSLRNERDALLLALGEAAYAEDAGQVGSLREWISSVDERIAACEREMEQALAGARERVRKEKAASQSTEQFAVVEKPPPVGTEDRTRTAATAQRSASPRSA
jgi:hypothetical protein